MNSVAQAVVSGPGRRECSVGVLQEEEEEEEEWAWKVRDRKCVLVSEGVGEGEMMRLKKGVQKGPAQRVNKVIFGGRRGGGCVCVCVVCVRACVCVWLLT